MEVIVIFGVMGGYVGWLIGRRLAKRHRRKVDKEWVIRFFSNDSVSTKQCREQGIHDRGLIVNNFREATFIQCVMCGCIIFIDDGDAIGGYETIQLIRALSSEPFVVPQMLFSDPDVLMEARLEAQEHLTTSLARLRRTSYP